MAKNSIDLQIGLPTEPQTSISVQILSNPAKRTEKHQVKFFFPCREKSFARSLQVLLDPYFHKWEHLIEVSQENVVVSVAVSETLISSELALELKLGMKVDGLKENFISEIFESLSLKLSCQDIQELCHVLGLGEIRILSSEVSLTIDPEDLPSEFIQFYHKELGKYFKYLEVLDAIRPMLSNTNIRVVGSIGNLVVNGEINY